MKYPAFLASVALTMPLSVAAQVYKCTDSSGAVVVQQVPCLSSAPAVGGEIRAREAAHQRNRDLVSQAAKLSELDRIEKERVQRIETDKQHKATGADVAFDPVAVKKDCGVTELPEGPAPGMTEQRMLSCTWLGRAKTLKLVNTTQVVGSVARQYEDTLGVLRYVYTRDGVVTGVQR